jgi:hypothetical protein
MSTLTMSTGFHRWNGCVYLEAHIVNMCIEYAKLMVKHRHDLKRWQRDHSYGKAINSSVQLHAKTKAAEYIFAAEYGISFALVRGFMPDCTDPGWDFDLNGKRIDVKSTELPYRFLCVPMEVEDVMALECHALVLTGVQTAWVNNERDCEEPHPRTEWYGRSKRWLTKGQFNEKKMKADDEQPGLSNNGKRLLQVGSLYVEQQRCNSIDKLLPWTMGRISDEEAARP